MIMTHTCTWCYRLRMTIPVRSLVAAAFIQILTYAVWHARQVESHCLSPTWSHNWDGGEGGQYDTTRLTRKHGLRQYPDIDCHRPLICPHISNFFKLKLTFTVHFQSSNETSLIYKCGCLLTGAFLVFFCYWYINFYWYW